MLKSNSSNLWAEIVLHNGAKGKIVDLVFNISDGPGQSDIVLAKAAPFVYAFPVSDHERMHNIITYIREKFGVFLGLYNS